jgi:hypothetical protein
MICYYRSLETFGTDKEGTEIHKEREFQSIWGRTGCLSLLELGVLHSMTRMM